MLAEVCGYLNNYFDVERHNGVISIQDGVVYCDSKEITMTKGQHFALLRKNFVLGVYEYEKDELKDRVFEGKVWIMDLPDDFVSLVAEITAWQTKYGGAGSGAMSPFNSESFGGYSYSKSSGSSNSNKSAVAWQDAYGSRLAKYKKVSLL